MREQLSEITLITLGAIIVFYAPAKYALIVLLLLILVDTYWGIRASKKMGREITSNRFNNLFAKVASYFIFVAFGLIVAIEFKIQYGVWLLCAYPIYSEIKSIDENQKACGNKGILANLNKFYRFVLALKKKQDKLRGNE